MNTKIEFLFGAGVKVGGSAVSDAQQRAAVTKICRAATRNFGGCTLVETTGEWFDPDSGTVVSEDGYALSVVFDKNSLEPRDYDGLISEVAEEIKSGLEQSCVMVLQSDVESSLY